MGRRRRENSGDELPGASPAASPAVADSPSESEARIDVRMSGPARAIRKELGVSNGGKGSGQAAEADGHGDPEKFAELLRNPRYLAKVKRIRPKTWQGQRTNIEVWACELPLTLESIREEVQATAGGGHFRVAVVDPDTGGTVDARVFEIEGDPIIESTEPTQEELEMLGARTEKTAAEVNEQTLERQARLTAKQIEVENLQQQLVDVRNRQGSIRKRGNEDDSRLNDLERRLSEAKHAAEIERIQREADRKVEEVSKKLDLLLQNHTAKPQGPSDMTLLLGQMQKDREASDARFNALMNQMKDDKLNTLLEEMKSLRHKPDSGGMEKAMESFVNIAKLLGVNLPGQDDDEDDDADPDKPWYERLADKYIPRLLDTFEEKERKGEKVSREEFMSQMAKAAKDAEDDAVARAQQRLLQNQPQPGLPAPQPSAPARLAGPPTVMQLPPPAPVQDLPPPQPGSTPPPPAAAAPPAPVSPKMTLQEEILLRVSGVLEILSREAELRPNEYLWNYEGCWQSLPETLLEKVATAPDPVAMVDAFAIEGISPERLGELKAKVSGSPRALAWVKMGHDELREWWPKKVADPKFDPFEEDEGEGEGE